MDNRLLIAKSEPLWNTNNRVIFLVGSLIILLFALPLFGLNSFYLHLFIMIFMHAVMAQSWNVIAGFSVYNFTCATREYVSIKVCW